MGYPVKKVGVKEFNGFTILRFSILPIFHNLFTKIKVKERFLIKLAKLPRAGTGPGPSP